MLIRKKIILVVLCTLYLFGKAHAQRVVIVGLDGISTDGFKKAKHPHIDSMLSNGTLSLTTRPVMPSVTLPNWTSHLCGSGPEEHGVTANNWTMANRPLKALETDEQGYYPSIFKVVKDHAPKAKTAFYYNWKELINPFNTAYLDEVVFQFNDQYDTLQQKAFDFIQANRKSPTLVFLYSVHTDHAGHSHHWMSPQYIHSIEQADSSIGVFLNKLKAEDLYEDTHFVFITDHGGHTETGHGGVSMQEMQVPWGVSGPKIKKAGSIDFYNSNKNTSWLIARIFGIKPKFLPDSWTGSIDGKLFRK